MVQRQFNAAAAVSIMRRTLLQWAVYKELDKHALYMTTQCLQRGSSCIQCAPLSLQLNRSREEVALTNRKKRRKEKKHIVCADHWDSHRKEKWSRGNTVFVFLFLLCRSNL